MEELSIEHCKEHIVSMLKHHKMKDIEIVGDGDIISFKFKDFEYQIYIESSEDVHYSVTKLNGVDLDSDFWMNKDEYEDYTYIEDYLLDVVLDNKYAYVKKVWSTLEKLESSDEEDDLVEIVSAYFGLVQ